MTRLHDTSDSETLPTPPRRIRSTHGWVLLPLQLWVIVAAAAVLWARTLENTHTTDTKDFVRGIAGAATQYFADYGKLPWPPTTGTVADTDTDTDTSDEQVSSEF